MFEKPGDDQRIEKEIADAGAKTRSNVSAWIIARNCVTGAARRDVISFVRRVTTVRRLEYREEAAFAIDSRL